MGSPQRHLVLSPCFLLSIPIKFKEIQEAYEILSDPDRKAVYDRFGMSGVRDDGDSGFGFGGGSKYFLYRF